MPYNDPHHVVKTSAQWDERAIEFWVVPRGCLCVELTPDGKTKIKIGEGNKFYSQLPYVNDMSDLENYYTKEEVDNIVTNINLMAIRSTDEYDTKNDLPTGGNKLGDVRFVKSSSPSIKTDPDVYLWNGSRWIYVGYELQDIDLSQYLKKDEFHELFDPVREKVEEMYPKMHTHENKNILDRIEEPYSTVEKEKLAGLENYDDTEIRELIAETGHTHPNKPVLDTITDDSLWSESDRTKFESLHNYDDTGVRNRLTDLESTAHTHSNKNILDQVTAAFTVEDKTKLDSLHNNEVFIGTDGMYGGREGLVPAPTIIDAGKFLCADGTWKAAGEIVYDFRGATASEDGTNGLVPAPMAGEQSYYLRGDGTWAKVKQGGDKYKAGDGIYILSDEVISDTFPLEIFAKSSRTSQYVIYGSAAGVGEWDGTNYVLSVTVEADGEETLTTQVLYNARLYTGDYIDYSRQIIHHAKEDMRQYITLYNDPTYGTSGIIQGKTGQIAGNYNYNPGVTNYIEVTPGEIYWVKAFPDEYIYFDNSYHCIFDENYNVTRYFATKGAGAMTIEIQPGEKYARFVGKPSWGILDPGFLYRMSPYEEPCVLPSIVLYPNKINTIDVANTNKPSEIYIEAVTDEPDDPDDPMSKYTGIIYNEGVLDIAQEHPDSLNKLTVHFRETEKVLTLPEGNKYKSGDGIYILAGDASSTTLPVEIYAKANKLKQYVLYGGTDPVGDWDSSASKYVIPIKVSAEGMSDMSTSVLLDDPIGNGDYIDYANQQFVHTRTNMTFGVRSGEWGRWIDVDGGVQNWSQDRMAPSDYIAISSEYVYLYYPGNMHGCDQFGIPCYAALYDENKVFVRSILLRSLTEVTIEAQPGEAYLRVSYGYYQGSSYRLTKIGEVVTPIVLPPVLIYANKINTIDVMTTNKPAEIYVETAVNSGSEDPMADITGIIYNDGILDVTQENPNALNELTIHFRESDKVITVPTGGGGVLYDAGDGIEFTYNHMIDMLFDRTAFLDSVTSVQRGTISKDTITGAFTLTATGNDAYTLPDRSSIGTVYSIQADPNTTYKLTWTSDDPTVHGNVFVFENGDVITMYLVDQATLNELTFITSSTCQTLNFRFGVQNSGDSLTYSDIALYKIIGDATINAKLGSGLEVDNNNDINVKLGDGLYFDADGAIATSGDNDYTAGEGIDIIGTTRPIDINYIRLDINNSRDNGSGGIIQFRNIRVLDNNGNSLQFSHASSIYGDGSAVEYGQNTRDESPQAMIEGRNKTCCTNFSLTKAPLKITFTLTSEISIANITSFSILTGADYTTRDPVSWDIYASNDGVTWYKIQEAHSPDVTTARSTWITDIPFVIPPDAVEILPGVKTITAKLGTGLSFDSNDAIELDNAIRIKLNCNNEPD